MSFWKVLLTWPYLLLIYLKATIMTKKVLKNPSLVPEAKRYIWVQKKAKYIKWLYNVKINPSNIENWPKSKGCLLVANHQSNFDAIILLLLNNYQIHAPVGFIAKEEIKYDRFARKFVFLIDVFFIKRSDPRSAIAVFKEAQELIRIPRTIVIFPEGTRSKQQAMANDFKPGAFPIAYRAYVPIVPVTIINSYQIFNKNYHGKKKIEVIFHPSIEPQNFINIPSTILAKNIQKQIATPLADYAK